MTPTRKAFLRSVALHAALAAGALLTLVPRPAPPLSPPSAPVWVEVEAGGGDRGARRPSRPPSNPSSHSRLPLRSLGIPLDEMIGVAPTGSADAGLQAEGSARDGRMHGIDLAREGKENPLMRRIRARIEATLVYPRVLHGRGIEGDVQARIWIAPDGRFLREETERSLSGPPYLRVQVARALREAFRGWAEPVAQGFEIEALFRFDIRESADETLLADGSFSLDRGLAFLRIHHQSALEWELGPLSGLGPFTLNADLLWLPRKIAEAASNRAEIDPLDSYRQDPAW